MSDAYSWNSESVRFCVPTGLMHFDLPAGCVSVTDSMVYGAL